MKKTIFQEPGNYNVTLEPGYYRFECWGAQGGSGLLNGEYAVPGGNGAYVSGYIQIRITTTFYCFVGGAGGNGIPKVMVAADGGYNGGGKGGPDSNDDDGSGGGGGASDIRVINGDYDNIESLKSRIIVSAGGSGSAYNAYGAPGGALTGFIKTERSRSDIIESNTTNQTCGYKLGIGEDGRTNRYTPSSGAGGGYYGGVASEGAYNNVPDAISSSGSSYISGHEGCAPNDQYLFKNTIMLHGNSEFLNANGFLTTGNVGNGSIVITQINKYTLNNKKVPFNYLSLIF